MFEIRTTTVFDKWFKSLKDRTAKAKVRIQITRMSLGNFGDVKPVGQGVSESRINYGPGYRLYHIKRGNSLCIVLAGGTKRTQKRDIEKAKTLANNLEN